MPSQDRPYDSRYGGTYVSASFKRENYKCVDCGSEAKQVDHIVPWTAEQQELVVRAIESAGHL
jgi:hypothetical protein